MKMVQEDGLAAQLDQLLSEGKAAAAEREKQAFDRAVDGVDGQIVLFGAGNLGRKTLAGMRRLGLEPCAFADNNPTLRGQSVDEIPVYPVPEAAGRFGRTAAFLVTIWNSRSQERMAERLQELRNLGCEHVAPVGLFFWKYPDIFLPYFPLDLPHKAFTFTEEIRKAFCLFDEIGSRREYLAQLAFRLLLDFDGMGWPERVDQYAPADLFDLSEHEVFVDCGAFDGDTIAAFADQQGDSFSRIIAFEPHPANCERLQQRLLGLPKAIRDVVMLFPNALGSRNETVYFESEGMETSRVGTGSLPVQCVTLDDALEPFTPTLIKFDIEGAEPCALEGARRVLARCRPVLAVSVYHEQAHLWQLPLQMAEICDDYKFFLRPQGTEGWDLICYAIPVERLKK
ncbi:MAG TPA: FkbM family methyltransferase [Acidobacteriaceae bacterium]|nr:FkbM family methyltransferase [Acidobacteriaceae bacterium]